MDDALPKNKVKLIGKTKSDQPVVSVRSHQLSSERNLTELSKKNSGKPIINNPYEDHKIWVQYLEKKIQQAEQDQKKIQAEFQTTSEKINQTQKKIEQIQSNLFEMIKKQREIKIKLNNERDESTLDDIKLQAKWMKHKINTIQQLKIQAEQSLNMLLYKSKKINERKRHIQEFILQNRERLNQQKYPILPRIKQKQKQT